MKLRDVIAYGTSEGVKKEWDTRGRKSGKEMREDWETRTHNTPGEVGEREAKNIAKGIRSVDKQDKEHGFKKGDLVVDRYGNKHEIAETRGTTLITTQGRYLHSTKVSSAKEEY